VFRTPNSVLAALLATALVVTLVLAWFGWRNLEQEGAIEAQRARERMESGADAMAAGIRGKLAEAAERLSGWISNPDAPLAPQDGAAIVAGHQGRFRVMPPGALPFVPGAAPVQAQDREFAAAEAIEFTGAQLGPASEQYRNLSRRPERRIRAGALVRLGRVLRKLQDLDGAMDAYRLLARMGDVSAGGLPAELAGLDGERLTQSAAGDPAGEREIASRIARFIDSGHWRLPRGASEFYREMESREPKPESWLLAEALARLWESERDAPSSAGSLRVIESKAGRF
jgi:hypothetical protein